MRKDINLGLFSNERTNKTLIYYPVAKNANSSAKLFLIEHLGLKNKFYFIEDEIPRHKHTKKNSMLLYKNCTPKQYATQKKVFLILII